MLNLVCVILYFDGEIIRRSYGVDYNTSKAIVKVKITPETTYAELVALFPGSSNCVIVSIGFH